MDAEINPEHLRRFGRGVGTIIDVGSYVGTGWLWTAFPRLPFIMVEPIRSAEAKMVQEAKEAGLTPRYTFVTKACGAAPGRALLRQPIDKGNKSSLHERTDLSAEDGASDAYEVEVTTLDAIIDELQPDLPIGLKIDTEGSEIDVMRGLDRHAGNVAFVIAEVSVRKRFVGGYRFSEMIATMKDRGFEALAVVGKAGKLRPRYMDVLFVREDSPLFD